MSGLPFIGVGIRALQANQGLLKQGVTFGMKAAPWGVAGGGFLVWFLWPQLDINVRSVSRIDLDVCR